MIAPRTNRHAFRPSLNDAPLEERARRYAGYGTDRDGHAGLHLGALLQAGFAEAEVLWRGRSSTIVAAFKA